MKWSYDAKFLRYVCDEYTRFYIDQWFSPEEAKKLNLINSRVRWFFGPKLALKLKELQSQGQVHDFFVELKNFFESQKGIYSTLNIEACFGSLIHNKSEQIGQMIVDRSNIISRILHRFKGPKDQEINSILSDLEDSIFDVSRRQQSISGQYVSRMIDSVISGRHGSEPANRK